MSGLIMQVAKIPIIEICPKAIEIMGIVAKVADKDALILEHKKSGTNGVRRLQKEVLKIRIPNNAE